MKMTGSFQRAARFIASWNSRFSALAGPGFENVKTFRRLILRVLKNWMCPENASQASYFQGLVRIQNDLNGAGATSRVTGAYFADGDQHLDYDTFQEHIAPNCESDFAFKGALRDHATAVWRGMIRVEPEAQKTNAYQECRNLMLSPTAHAVPIPGLEIMANDVRCTHGATVSRVDREQLFYLMTRGLPRAEAERMVVRGFFQNVLDRIELEPVREAVTAALEARIPQA